MAIKLVTFKNVLQMKN